jgi:AraC-like DNA-binding protein
MFWYYLRMDQLPSIQSDFVHQLRDPWEFTRLFDYLPDIYFYAKDRQSRFMKVSLPLLHMRGAQREEQILGKSDFDIHPRYLAEQYVREDQQVMESREPLPNQVWLVPAHDGSLQWFVSSKMPLFDREGAVIGLAGVLRTFEQTPSQREPFQQMEQVLAHVLRHHGERIDVPDLAKIAHLSVSQFDRRFKLLFQMTPQQYILRVRLNAACQALTSTRASLARIAQEAGFYDQSYFTKQFRKHMGVSPLAYRKQSTGERGAT